MREVWLATLRTRLLRPVPLVTLLAVYGLSAVFALTNRDLGSLTVLSCLLALLAANGIVGQDVADGSVQLLLARPLTRGRYLAGRLLGALTVSTAFIAAIHLTAWLYHRPPAADIAEVGVASLTAAWWTTALIFFFSTFLPGRADAVAAFGLFLGVGSLHVSRAHIEQPWASAAVAWLWDNVACLVRLTGPALTPAATTDLLRWASNVLLVLLAATLLFNRRQFGYAD